MTKNLFPFLYEYVVLIFGVIGVHKAVGIPEAIAVLRFYCGVINVISCKSGIEPEGHVVLTERGICVLDMTVYAAADGRFILLGVEYERRNFSEHRTNAEGTSVPSCVTMSITLSMPLARMLVVDASMVIGFSSSGVVEVAVTVTLLDLIFSYLA